MRKSSCAPYVKQDFVGAGRVMEARKGRKALYISNELVNANVSNDTVVLRKRVWACAVVVGGGGRGVARNNGKVHVLYIYILLLYNTLYIYNKSTGFCVVRGVISEFTILFLNSTINLYVEINLCSPHPLSSSLGDRSIHLGVVLFFFFFFLALYLKAQDIIVRMYVIVIVLYIRTKLISIGAKKVLKFYYGSKFTLLAGPKVI